MTRIVFALAVVALAACAAPPINGPRQDSNRCEDQSSTTLPGDVSGGGVRDTIPTSPSTAGCAANDVGGDGGKDTSTTSGLGGDQTGH